MYMWQYIKRQSKSYGIINLDPLAMKYAAIYLQSFVLKNLSAFEFGADDENHFYL